MRVLRLDMVLSTCLVGDLVLSPAPCFMSLLPRSMASSSPPQPFKLTACAPAPCFMGSPRSMASSAPLQAVKLKAWAPICHASSAVQSDLPLAQPVPMRSPPLSSPFVGLVWFGLNLSLWWMWNSCSKKALCKCVFIIFWRSGEGGKWSFCTFLNLIGLALLRASWM